MLKKLLSASIVAAAAAGSVRYCSEVLNNGDLSIRGPPGGLFLTLVDDSRSEDWRDGNVRYWRFLALRPMSANLKMRLASAPDATAFPIDYFLADDHGRVSQGEIRGENVEVRRMNFPRGSSTLKLSVKAKESDPNTDPSFPVLAELDDLEISDVDLNPEK